jgi:hypothetical protein
MKKIKNLLQSVNDYKPLLILTYIFIKFIYILIKNNHL